MNSRERIKALFKKEKTDAIPFGLGGCETASLHLLAYEKLKKILGINSDRLRMYSFMFNAIPELEYFEKSGADIIPVNTKLCPVPMWKDIDKNWKTVKLWGSNIQVPKAYNITHFPDGSMEWDGKGLYCPAKAYYFDAKPDDLEVDLDEIYPDDFHPPITLGEEYLRELEEQAKFLYETTDKALSIGETIFDLQYAPGGLVNSFMYMLMYPDRMKEFLARSLEAGKKNIIEVQQAVGKYCDVMSLAHDFGDNNGVTIGGNLWREIYKPYYKELFSYWKSHSSLKINLHSCGSLNEIIPDLIECGVDVLNPVQLCAKNMDAEHLKGAYGDKIIFMGGGYDAVACAGRTEEEVYNICFNNIKTLSCGGNYIFAGIHNIPGDVSESHLRAMLQAYKKANELYYK